VECYKLVMVLARGIFGCKLYLKNASLHCKLWRIIVREICSFGGFPLKEASELSFL
jgi:hypothetical protein